MEINGACIGLLIYWLALLIVIGLVLLSMPPRIPTMARITITAKNNNLMP